LVNEILSLPSFSSSSYRRRGCQICGPFCGDSGRSKYQKLNFPRSPPFLSRCTFLFVFLFFSSFSTEPAFAARLASAWTGSSDTRSSFPPPKPNTPAPASWALPKGETERSPFSFSGRSTGFLCFFSATNVSVRQPFQIARPPPFRQQ